MTKTSTRKSTGAAAVVDAAAATADSATATASEPTTNAERKQPAKQHEKPAVVTPSKPMKPRLERGFVNLSHAQKKKNDSHDFIWNIGVHGGIVLSFCQKGNYKDQPGFTHYIEQYMSDHPVYFDLLKIRHMACLVSKKDPFDHCYFERNNARNNKPTKKTDTPLLTQTVWIHCLENEENNTNKLRINWGNNFVKVLNHIEPKVYNTNNSLISRNRGPRTFVYGGDRTPRAGITNHLADFIDIPKCVEIIRSMYKNVTEQTLLSDEGILDTYFGSKKSVVVEQYLNKQYNPNLQHEHSQSEGEDSADETPEQVIARLGMTL